MSTNDPVCAIMPTVDDVNPADFLIGTIDQHSQFLTLARWHFEQRALAALLQSDDEDQARRLIHHTNYCAPNREFADRVMHAWAATKDLAKAVRSMDCEESWQIRCRTGQLDTISLTESTAHALIVKLWEECYGSHQ